MLQFLAKPGRNPRRRANTMENSNKSAIDRKRRGNARKRLEQMKDMKHPENCYSMEAASMQDLSFPNDICHEEMPTGTTTAEIMGNICGGEEGPMTGVVNGNTTNNNNFDVFRLIYFFY